MKSWIYFALLPVLWALVRKAERATRWLDLVLRPAELSPTPSNERVLEEKDFLRAVFSGPGLDSVISPDRTVLWQAGEALQTHKLPNGWQGLRLPDGSMTGKVTDHVVQTAQPCNYTVTYEGIRYTGTAFPWVEDQQLLGIVFRAMPTLEMFREKQTSVDARLAEIQRIAKETLLLAEEYGGSNAHAAQGA